MPPARIGAGDPGGLEEIRDHEVRFARVRRADPAGFVPLAGWPGVLDAVVSNPHPEMLEITRTVFPGTC